VSAAARRQRRLPRVRSSDVRDRPARRHRQGPQAFPARDLLGLGRRLSGPARPRRHAGLLSLVFPDRQQGRLRIPGYAAKAAADQYASRHARHGCAGPRLEHSRNHRSAARRRPATWWRAARARRGSRHRRPAGAAEIRELGPALSASVPAGTRGVRQPARRLRGQHRRGRQRGERNPRHHRRPRSTDHGTALRPLARADAAPVDQARRHAGRQSDELGAPAQSRSALPRGGELRHRRGRGQRRDLHELCVGADRRRARRKPEDQASTARDRSLDGVVRAPSHAARRHQHGTRVLAVGAGHGSPSDRRLDHPIHPDEEPRSPDAHVGCHAARAAARRAAHAPAAVRRRRDAAQPAHAHQRGRGERGAAQGCSARPSDRRPGGGRRASVRRADLDSRSPRRVSLAAVRGAGTRPPPRRDPLDRAADAGGAGRRARRRWCGDRAVRPAAPMAVGRWAGAGHDRGQPDPVGNREAGQQPELRARRPGLERAPGAGRERQPDGGTVQDRVARFLHAPRRRQGGGATAGAGAARSRRGDKNAGRRTQSTTDHPPPRPVLHRHPALDPRTDRR
jgi:hypothetical protein